MARKPGRSVAAPGLRYADPAWFERERESILLPSWQPACHLSDLPAPGTAVRVDFLGRSAFVLRCGDGEFRAFLNVCRHRGSRLVEGDRHTSLAYCVDGKVRCPYHGWTYDESGTLVHVPDEDGYPGVAREESGLHPLPVATGLGFLFVAFAAPLRPLADQLSPVASLLAPYRLEALRRLAEPRLCTRHADWKVICEHHLDRHRLSGTAFPDLSGARFGASTGPTDEVLCISGDIDGTRARSWSARAYPRWQPRVETLPADRQGTWMRCFLWPNVVLDAFPDLVRLTQVLPLGPGSSAVRETAFGQPDGSREMRVTRYLNERVHRHAASDDRRLVERRQAGLATVDGTHGPLAADEQGLRWFESRVAAVLEERA